MHCARHDWPVRTGVEPELCNLFQPVLFPGQDAVGLGSRGS